MTAVGADRIDGARLRALIPAFLGVANLVTDLERRRDLNCPTEENRARAAAGQPPAA